MKLIDADKLKDIIKYSRSVHVGYLNHCAEAGHEPDNKKLIEAAIKWDDDILELIDEMPEHKEALDGRS